MNDSLIRAVPVSVLAAAAAAGAAALLLSGTLWGIGLHLAALPALAALFVVLVWNTRWGLCFAAFSLAPLGAVSHEILDVTLYLPEVLILALAGKEAVLMALRRERIAAPMPLRSLAVYMAAAVLAVGTGIAYGNGTIATLQDFRQFTEYLLLFWLVMQRAADRDLMIEVLLCFVAGAAICAVHAIVQHAVAVGLVDMRYAPYVHYRGLRSGSFHHANTLGGLLVLAVGAAAGLYLAVTRRSTKVFLAICIGLCLVAEVYTKSRGGWISMAAALVFIGVCVRPSRRTLAMAAAVGVAFAVLMGPAITQRMSTFSDPDDDRSFMGRTQYYTAATHIIGAHPLLGLGWGAYYEVPAIVNAEQYVESPRPAGAPDATVHSLYLQIPVKTGLLGLAGFLLLMLAWTERVWRAWRTAPRNERYYPLFVGSTAGLVGFFLQNGIENIFHQPVMAQAFWMLFGLSFATAHQAGRNDADYRAPIAIMAAGIAGFLVFLYGCLWLATYDTGEEYIEKNVKDALAADDLDKALQIAYNATQEPRPAPVAFAVYGSLLIDGGLEEEGVAEIEKGLAIRRNWVAPYQPTMRAFYSAPARLALGEYYLSMGRATEAAAQFELARVHDEPTLPKYSEYHASCYAAYASLGLWSRALEFADLTDAELDAMEAADLQAIAAEAAARDDGALAMRAAERNAAGGDGPYMKGRAYYEQGDYAAALQPLEIAAAAQIPHAAYFLGMAQAKSGNNAQAVSTLLSTARDDPYRAFALAEAANTSDTPEAPGDEITAIVDALAQSPAPVQPEQKGRYTLLAARGDSNGRRHFPVLVLWQDREPDSAPVESSPDELLLDAGKGRVLQLQWVENLTNWECIARVPEGVPILPGWIDTARDWFDAREDYAGRVRTDADGSGPSFELYKRAWFYSMPIPVEPGAGYWLSGKLQGSAWMGWQALDKDEEHAFEGDVATAAHPIAWSDASAYARAGENWDTLRIQIDHMQDEGTSSVRDVVLARLKEPGR